MYQVKIKKSAQKELQNIPKHDRKRILLALASLANNPFEGKRLKGEFKEYFSIRVWPYRIIYVVFDKELMIVVIRIGHRQGIYK